MPERTEKRSAIIILDAGATVLRFGSASTPAYVVARSLLEQLRAAARIPARSLALRSTETLDETGMADMLHGMNLISEHQLWVTLVIPTINRASGPLYSLLRPVAEYLPCTARLALLCAHVPALSVPRMRVRRIIQELAVTG